MLASVCLLGIVLASLLSTAAGATFPGRPGKLLVYGKNHLSLSTFDPRTKRKTHLVGGVDSYGAQFAPDGRTIAFSRNHNLTEESDIFVRSPRGKLKNITRSTRTDERSPSFSGPGGKRIAFTRVDQRAPLGERFSQVWVMNADGSSQRRLVGGRKRQAYEPAFSSDGRRVAFLSNPGINGRRTHVFVINSDGSNRHEVDLGIRGEPEKVGFTPDGESLVVELFRSGRQLAALKGLGGGPAHALTKRRDPYKFEFGAVVSPSGKALAYDAFHGSHEYIAVKSLRGARKVRPIKNVPGGTLLQIQDWGTR